MPDFIVLVLLSADAKRVRVSCIWDFLKVIPLQHCLKSFILQGKKPNSILQTSQDNLLIANGKYYTTICKVLILFAITQIKYTFIIVSVPPKDFG